MVAHIGDRYDRRQLVDLGRYLTPFHLLPGRLRRKAFFSGESDSRSVICSSLIAQAFLKVRYPILPLLPPSMREEKEEGHFPWGTRMRSVHPRLVLPRDFDLSPYFRIVKFNSVEEGPIDAPLAGVVRGERERPVAVAVVEEAQVAGRRARRAHGVQSVISLLVHLEPEAPGCVGPELPAADTVGDPARVGLEAALDHGQERQGGRDSRVRDDLSQPVEVPRPAGDAVDGLPVQRPLRTEPLLPRVDRRMLEAGEVELR